MARWLHTLQQFQFFIVQPPLLPVDSVLVSIAPQWIRPWKWRMNHLMLSQWGTQRMLTSFPYSPVKIGWHNLTTICPARPLNRRKWKSPTYTDLQLEDPTCVTLLEWIRSDTFPPWMEVKSLCPELRFLRHHRNNLSADANGVIWRKRSSEESQLQLLVQHHKSLVWLVGYIPCNSSSSPSCSHHFSLSTVYSCRLPPSGYDRGSGGSTI